MTMSMASQSATNMEVDKQDKKRKKGDVSSDFETSSHERDLSILDLDSGKVISSQPHSTPRAESKDRKETLSSDAYDTLMKKISVMEKCMSKLDKVDKLDKLDTMEHTVNQMEHKLDSFNERIKKTEDIVSNVEKSVEYVCDQYDTMERERKIDREQIKSINTSVRDVKKENNELKTILFEMQRLNHELKEEVLDMKCRNMRDNLLFTNIVEYDKEDTETELNKFLESQMKITGISFERVHRIGRKVDTPVWGHPAKPRVIVAKFTYFKDRERLNV